MDKPADQNCDLGSLDDVSLCCLLSSGQHDALTVLFTRYKTLVFNVAKKILRHDGEAEEVVQQVFFEVYKHIPEFDTGRGSFKTWLLQYAYHRSINRRNHLISIRFYLWDELDYSFEQAESHDHRLRLWNCEMAFLVEELLSTLEGFQRHVVELSYLQGLTAEEIAKRTGASVWSVQHNVQRGKVKMRFALHQRRVGVDV